MMEYLYSFAEKARVLSDHLENMFASVGMYSRLERAKEIYGVKEPPQPTKRYLSDIEEGAESEDMEGDDGDNDYTDWELEYEMDEGDSTDGILDDDEDESDDCEYGSVSPPTPLRTHDKDFNLADESVVILK
eukprot:m.19631 g.19631  ORF g.19631 m.19631 type:complete len:132 (-) comp6637_c0_seq1:1372-1767(-)